MLRLFLQVPHLTTLVGLSKYNGLDSAVIKGNPPKKIVGKFLLT
jgi:hypothetical protein